MIGRYLLTFVDNVSLKISLDSKKMRLKKAEIKELIISLGFISQQDDDEIYYKIYPIHNDYLIKIKIEQEKIEYGLKIKLGDITTCNFENSENFVVLECVNRILEKGYPPARISLEQKWPMGRKEKGKLDILIKDKDDKTYLMIECKTWGDEYVKEKRKMQRDGGQLFSYFQQDKAAKFLCLYSSRIYNNELEYSNDIVKVEEQWKELNNQKEIFDHWNKNFKDNGIFEEWTTPYGIEIKAITRGRLKELTEEDSGRIFNQFAEVLRHNVVSDKPNAFNKIFNLFLCKIVDEDRVDSEELQFQWLDNDTDEELQKRLSDLYKQGMKEYLTKEVTDYNDKQIEEKLYALDPEVRDQIKEMFTRVRLHKNNEFAFKEVFDEKSFRENAIVVREVVELIQPFQIRYTHKQQFLGDFFELLLSTGIKQEAGQFFTPVPIAKFVVTSIPIRELILKKIANEEINFLPYIIDFAAGSGHFLTEVMDELQNILDTIDPSKQKPSIKSKLKSWKESSFDWAYDYVYGIEADYRLVKTAKVSCFLNGDGLANVIHADGLDNFGKSIDYKGKLKEKSSDDPRDNGQFDILIANPPYSVSAFKNTLKFGNESFELFNRLTDDSSEIECLFIERMKQLLKIGGIGGVILPSTILNNPGIYNSAREIILKYFNINAITQLGTSTFMATGTPTIAMFLERRNNGDWKRIELAIKKFFSNPQDFKVELIDNAFSTYIDHVFDDITIVDYISFIKKNPNNKIKNQEIFIDLQIWFDGLTETKKLKENHSKELFNLEKQIIAGIKKKMTSKKLLISEKEIDFLASKQKLELERKILARQERALLKLFYKKAFDLEKEKMLYFFLTYPQSIVLITTGNTKDEEKSFLGYEFSNRRGHEGIKMFRDKIGGLTTKLYNIKELDFNKANYYVYKKFMNEEAKIVEDLSQNIFHIELKSLMNFNQFSFDKSINLVPIINPFNESNYKLVRAKELFVLEYGKPLSENQRVNGKYPVMGSNGITGYHDSFLIKGPSIIVGRKGSAGNVTYIEENCFPIDTTFYVVNISDYPLKYIYYLLLVLPLKSLSKSMGVPGLNRNNAYMLKVPLVDPKLVDEKIKYLDKYYSRRNKSYDSKKSATDNEQAFMKEFKNEIIRLFK